MVVQLSLTMQQESGLKRQVIDVGHINVQEVRIEDGQCLESGVHDIHVSDRHKTIGGLLCSWAYAGCIFHFPPAY